MEENTRKTRRTIRGVVIGDKNDKTIIVSVETHKVHAKYGKRIKYRKKYYVHDEKNEAKVGDEVIIMETRKLSATKTWRLVKIVKVHLASIKDAEASLEEQEGIAPKVEEEAPKAEAKEAK